MEGPSDLPPPINTPLKENFSTGTEQRGAGFGRFEQHRFRSLGSIRPGARVFRGEGARARRFLKNYYYNDRNMSGTLRVLDIRSAIEQEIDSSRRSMCFFRPNRFDVSHIIFNLLYRGAIFPAITGNGALTMA